MALNVKIKLVHPKAQAPVKGSKYSSCFDLRAVIEGDPVVIAPGQQAKFDTGIAFEPPEGWAIDVHSRSGHGFTHQIRLSNSTGIIDWDYRDTVKVALKNDSDKEFVVAHGDRIAQARLVELHEVEFEVVDQLSSTERGTGGLGSTGVK